MNHDGNRSRLTLLAAGGLITGLSLSSGCSAPLFGTHESREDRPSAQESQDAQEAPEKPETPAREQTKSTGGAEEMEIEPEDILKGGGDSEKDATRAPSRKDDTLKNPQEEDQESEDSKDRKRHRTD